MEVLSIIIDDEPHAVEELSEIVERIPGMVVSGRFEGVKPALDFLTRTGRVDIIFCDINMPMLNGIAAARLLKEHTDHLIYVTAYREYALDAFGVKASGYLVKPVDDKAVIHSVADIIKQKNRRQDKSLEEVLFIKGNHKNSFTKLALKEIVSIEAMLNYVTIRCLDSEEITYLSLKSVAEMLGKHENFYRVSKSVIINIDHMKTVDGNVIRLKNGLTYSVGETYKSAFHDFLRRRTLK